MTPDDVAIIAEDVLLLGAAADRFTFEFYATLFELDPDLRRLFPDDIEAQRSKLFVELSVLADRAQRIAEQESATAFLERARELGLRHEIYGVTAPMYATVEAALLAALHDVIDGFDEAHVTAWTRLYRLVADSMQTD